MNKLIVRDRSPFLTDETVPARLGQAPTYLKWLQLCLLGLVSYQPDLMFQVILPFRRSFSLNTIQRLSRSCLWECMVGHLMRALPMTQQVPH